MAVYSRHRAILTLKNTASYPCYDRKGFTFVLLLQTQLKLFYVWPGMQCNCGKWVTPAFQIHKNRVDETWNVHPPISEQPEPSWCQEQGDDQNPTFMTPCYRDKLWSCCSSQIPLVWYQWWFKAKKSKECFCEDLLKVYLFHSVAMDCMWKSQYTKLMIGETCWSVVMTADHCCMEVSP